MIMKRPMDMKRFCRLVTVVFLMILMSGCAANRGALPLSESFFPEPLSTTLFSGRGEAYRFEKGGWQKAPEYNYEFVVLKRNYDGWWETIKEMHRRHPGYNGLAGPRDETLHFTVHYSPEPDGRIRLTIGGAFGPGSGYADADFRHVVAEFKVSHLKWFYPFNTYRLTQVYDYEEGIMRETVELLEIKDGRETPFMKMEEQSEMYFSLHDPRLSGIISK
jgi:hypothetical protein